jgi:hypothetical protein
VERKTSCPKGNLTKPAPSKATSRGSWTHVAAPRGPVRHSLKDCRLIKNYVNNTLKPGMANPPKKGGPPGQQRRHGGYVAG